VNPINSCVEDNSAAITTIRNDSDGPGADPALEAHVSAIDSRVEDHSAAIASLENKLVINVDSGEFINRNSFVVTRSTPLYRNDPNHSVYRLFDGNASTRAALILTTPGPAGVVFIEFDMGAAVAVSGFRMIPASRILYRFPRDTRLFSGASSSGPWTHIGTSILAASPPSTNDIRVTFPSQSARYFRVVFTNVERDPYADFTRFDFIATQSVDVLESLDTRITQ